MTPSPYSQADTRELGRKPRARMPGHVALETATLEDLGDGRTRLINTSLFMTAADRDGMLQSGMEGGLNESYAALDRVLASWRSVVLRHPRRWWAADAGPRMGAVFL